MARGDSVTISFRLNLNREEDMEIWSFLTGGAIEPCFGDKSKFIKSALIRVVQGIKQNESEKRLVCELNAQREAIQNTMTGEADRIINAVKLIVKDEVERLAKCILKKKSRCRMLRQRQCQRGTIEPLDVLKKIRKISTRPYRRMRCLLCQISSRQIKRSYTPGNTKDKKVIPGVIRIILW